MTKRIPQQSAFRGISSKQWVRFVNTLTEDEAHFLIKSCCWSCTHESDNSGWSCTCEDDHTSIVQKASSTLPNKYSLISQRLFCVDTPPQPRLVGIELNPGPRRGRNSNTLVVTNVRKSNPAPASATRVTTQVVRRPTQRKRVRSRIPQSISGPNQFLKQYTDSLQDPWEFGPLDLGYGTLIETTKGTSYLRSSLVVNADGSFALALLPQNTNMVISNIAGAGVATWVNNQATNSTALVNQMSSARITSGGIRVFCLFPETSSSGVLFAGSLPGLTTAGFSVSTPTSLAGASTSELGIGSRGSRSVILPIDMSAFNMSPNVVATWPTSTPYPYSVPYVSGLGFPSGTVVWYEAVLNLEGVPLSGAAGVGVDADRKTPQASDYFLTPENLMRSASGLLTQTVVMDAVQGLASFIHPSAGRLIGQTRSIFGSGRNLQSALVSGRNSSRQSRQSTVMIEEMKEEANPSRSRGWLAV